MKASKTEPFLKAKLEARKITPSPEIWEELEKKLLQKKKSKLIILRYAAIAILILGSVSYFYQGAPNGLQPSDPSKKIVFEAIEPLEQDNSHPEIKETSEFVTIPKQFQLTAPLKKGLQPFLIQNKQIRITTDFSKIKVPEIALKKESQLLNDSLLSLETDELIRLAFDALKKNKSEAARQKERALALLLEIEDELISETSLKHRVFDILKNSYSKIKVATNESTTNYPKQ
jgi:hypothetical protein